jgi:hypothetical protein
VTVLQSARRERYRSEKLVAVFFECPLVCIQDAEPSNKLLSVCWLWSKSGMDW